MTWLALIYFSAAIAGPYCHANDGCNRYVNSFAVHSFDTQPQCAAFVQRVKEKLHADKVECIQIDENGKVTE